MSNFRVGQKVVCVDDYFDNDPSPLIKGATYVVSGIYNNCDCGPCVTVGIPTGLSHRIGEIVQCPNCLVMTRCETHEWEFRSSRFRPLDELTDQVDRIEKEGLPAELLEELADAMEPQYAMN